MKTIERKLAIKQRLQENGSVNIVDLAEELDVSSMTIRRDLAQFAREGLVTVEYGGAVLNDGSLLEYDMALKKSQCSEEKRRIASRCADYIRDGDSIFLDAGTTTCEIAKLIMNRSNLLIMTNSLLAMGILSRSSSARVIMCPGVFRERSMAFMGQLTDNFVRSFKIDKLFLGVEGVDLEGGVTVPDLTDGVTKQNLVEYSKEVICAADSSKFGKSWFFSVCPLSRIDALVTDEGLDEGTRKGYTGRGINLITV